MSVKSGLKTWTMLSGLVLGLVFVTGCNSEETATDSAAKPSVNTPPAVKPAGDTKPMPAPSAKPDDKEKK